MKAEPLACLRLEVRFQSLYGHCSWTPATQSGMKTVALGNAKVVARQDMEAVALENRIAVQLRDTKAAADGETFLTVGWIAAHSTEIADMADVVVGAAADLDCAKSEAVSMQQQVLRYK